MEKSLEQRKTEERIMYSDKLRERGIPEKMISSIVEYICTGRLDGGFLRALFSNDFMETYIQADEENRAALPKYAEMLYNDIPYSAVNNSRDWRDTGGLFNRLEDMYSRVKDSVEG